MNKQFLKPEEPVPPFDQLHEGNPEISIHLDIHETNTSDGGEFLNDAIRMSEQEFEDTSMPPDEIALYVSEPFINEPDYE